MDFAFNTIYTLHGERVVTTVALTAAYMYQIALACEDIFADGSACCWL